jgi:ParB family chromosome partitioning protein
MAVKKKFASSVLGRGLDDIGTGRGLDALIDTTSEVHTEGSSNLNEIDITQIEPNPNQPRREFDQEALQELASSIKELGIIQPITLRKVAGQKFQIIAGERRWRASQMAGLTKIPAYIVDVEDQGVMEMALVENIQREDLNAIEIALAYQHLAEATGMTQAKISERVGKSRAAVTNYMRLLKLPAQVQIALKNHEIEMGHARALLAIDSPSQQIKLFKEVQQQQFSVRKVEEMVQALKGGEDIKTAKGKIASRTQLPDEFNMLKNKLAQFFQTKVQMTCSSKGKGKITIQFDDEDQLERIMNILDKVNG